MNKHQANECTENTHDLAPSLFEANVLACLWPGCGYTMPAPAATAEASVSVAVVAVEAVVFARAA